MSDSMLHEEKVEEKVPEDLDCDESLLEPAVELSMEENETEAGDDNFFPFDNLAVEMNEDVEENAATSETIAENGQDLSNMSEDACDPETEEAVADSTIPESNESSHDAMTYENSMSIKSEPENLEDMPETNLADFIYSSTPVTFDEGSNSTSDEAKEDMIKKPQLYRFPKVVKAVEMAEYETLQMIYQLLYQRSAWDTQEILKQRILEFSGFNFLESSEEYFNRDMMLKTQPNEVLVKIGHVLGLEQIRNMYSGGDKARFDLITAIMKFLTSMKSLVKPRRRTTYAKSSDLGIEPSPKNLITKCGCRARCLAKTPKSQRVAFLQYLKELENKNILDSYLYNLIEIKHNARKPGEDKQKFREYAYQFKVRFGTREFSVCKGGFAVYHGLKQRKLQTMQNKLKNNEPLPPKMDLNDFPPFNVPPKVSPRKSWSETSSYGTLASNQGTCVSTPSKELKTYSAADGNTPKLEDKIETDTEKSQQKLMPFLRKSENKRHKVSPTVMKTAVLSVIENHTSLRAAGILYGIDRKTLGRYVEKYKNSEDKNIEFKANHVSSQIFTSKEENVLKEYFLLAAKLNYGLTSKATRELAYQYAVANNKKIPENWSVNQFASYDWLKGFYHRHTDLSLQQPELTSSSTTTVFDKTMFGEFFLNLHSILEKKKYGPEAIFNVDETEIPIAHEPGKLIALKGEKQISQTTSAERGTLVTICCGISAIGTSVPPFLVFPRVHVEESMTRGGPPGIQTAAHPSGLMTKENFVLYIRHFIKYTKCGKGNEVLIILDNHESHISVQCLQLCEDNGITLLTLPPHTSHKLQPLDRIIFGSFKTFYNSAASDFMVTHPGQPITIYDVPELVCWSFSRAFTPQNIQSGFACTRIWPLNTDIFSDSDFLESYNTNKSNLTISNVSSGSAATSFSNLSNQLSLTSPAPSIR